MNADVYRNIPSASLQRNPSKIIGRNFIMQKNYDPKHTAVSTRRFIKWGEKNI